MTRNNDTKPFARLMTVHFALITLAGVILAASLVFFLIRWESLPERAGIHFAADGTFDVYAERYYGFYPHIVGGVFIAGLAFAGRLVIRKSTGLSISDKGERLFKTEFCLTLDCLALLLGCCFANWSRSVSLQVPLDTDFMRGTVSAMMCVGAAGIIAEALTARIYRTDKGAAEAAVKKAALEHRMHRIAAWMLAAAGWLTVLLMRERLPSEDETGYYHLNDLAYFADFDAYMSKWFLFVPPVLITVTLAVLEVTGHKAKVGGNRPLVIFTDRLKLISAVFFFICNIFILSEIKINPLFICLYITLCLVSAGGYLISRRKQKRDNTDASQHTLKG